MLAKGTWYKIAALFCYSEARLTLHVSERRVNRKPGRCWSPAPSVTGGTAQAHTTEGLECLAGARAGPQGGVPAQVSSLPPSLCWLSYSALGAVWAGGLRFRRSRKGSRNRPEHMVKQALAPASQYTVERQPER